VTDMNPLQDWGNITVTSLQEVWSGFIGFLPSLIGALIVLILGWIVAIAVGRLISQILKAFRLDSAFDRVGVKKSLKKAGYKFSASEACGNLVKWFLIIVFVMAASDIVGLSQISRFLREIAFYLPQVIIAAVILLAGVLIANLLSNLIRASVRAAGLLSGDFLAGVARWTVYVFTVFAVLDQLGVARAMMNTLLTGFVALLAIAGGLAFGLGGRDIAADALKKMRDELTE